MIFIGPFCMLPAGATVMLLATGDGVPVGVGEPNPAGLDDGAEAFDFDPPEEDPPDDPLPVPAEPLASDE